MFRFIVKLIVLIGFNAALGVGILTMAYAGRRYEQWETDSVLYVTPRNTQFDLVILGSSRAKLLTRLKPNLECLERELEMNVLGMATPFGGGVVPAKMYLDRFYDRGNNPECILFFVDPFMFFSKGPNEGHKLVYYEPFDPLFLIRLVRNGFDHRRLATYVRTKFSLERLCEKPEEIGYHTRALSKEDLDPEAMRKRVDSLYYNGVAPEVFERYKACLEHIMRLAEKNGDRMIIAFAPTLLGREPGHEHVLEFLKKLGKQYEFEVYDFTDAIQDHKLYSDFDHLNSPGVERFVKGFLKPAITKPPEKTPDYAACFRPFSTKSSSRCCTRSQVVPISASTSGLRALSVPSMPRASSIPCEMAPPINSANCLRASVSSSSS